ncbi:hypothetical protein HCN44_009725 [Aphidius gifuensis]|uniref:Methionine--tRNA ligase, mitochondrial n=1 Tax=Aphidius gifuensis TaxID=684658 RepID=A0A835CWB3_APHGI|nr:methionine--tRNA ligase, mitochondrial [Aphidius gifuensis]KAF7998327.1 hypothetical protein HCN44_009725 [Aphidius gifuensis]
MYCHSSNNKNAYITTPIFYVNAGPHLGHLYSAALADALAKYHEMHNYKVFFSTGTDEHGNKVRDAALLNKLSPKNYCDNISLMFKSMCDNFGVDYTNFIRTTDEKHQLGVQQFWKNLDDGGHIYKGKYSGWYCLSDEAFVPTNELEEIKQSNGIVQKISSSSGNTVEWMEEENYKFKLSNFQDDLKYWLKDLSVVKPIKYHKILLSMIDEGSAMNDLSISRPTSRAPWGINVPNDDSQTIYVWLDALVNYLTSLGYPDDKYKNYWPPTIQVIGKDILKFHGIYWPAFLIASGLEPPKTLLCHSHWTVNDEKMSKSKGNVVVPDDAAVKFTNEGLRYFLLREAVPHNDGNYNEDKVRKILNTELADTLGNLVSRCMGKIVNPQGIIPQLDDKHLQLLKSNDAINLVNSLKSLSSLTQEAYEDFNLHHVVDFTMNSLRLSNKMIETHKPWELVKNINENNNFNKLEAVLALGLESVRISSLILNPIIPKLTSNLLDYLQVPIDARKWNNTNFLITGKLKDHRYQNDDVKNMIFFKKLKL